MFTNDATLLVDVVGWQEAERLAGAFLAGYASTETRRAYRTDLRHWLAFCAAHGLHPFRGLRRTHIELYLRDLEAEDPPLATATRYRRIATLSSWLRWLEDEDLNIGNPAARFGGPSGIPGRSRGSTATSSPTSWRRPRARAATRTRPCVCSVSTACVSPRHVVPM